MEAAKWWEDWQHSQHAKSFDFRAAMPVRTLVREYEAFNDVVLLNRRIAAGASTIAEIGCATGEFFRYLQVKHPLVSYFGFDVSRPALDRACAKYPSGRFVQVEPDSGDLAEKVLTQCSPDILYSKDVLHHQVRPFDFLDTLLKIPTSGLIFRCRTRDAGPTEWDPEKSCQHHYGGWMPYIVINTEELVERIRIAAPQSAIAVLKSPAVLGGVHGRYLPRDCYLPETRTAETAVEVRLRPEGAVGVQIEERPDGRPAYGSMDLAWFGLQRVSQLMRRQ